MKRAQKIILAVLSGVIPALAWPENGFPFLLFAAFIPLLYLEEQHFRSRESNTAFGIYWYAFIAFATFNALTTYWIYNSTFIGVVAAVLINTLLMSAAFQLFHITRRKIPAGNAGYIAFIGYWLSMEYLHLRWDLNWPWLNLGHGFAAYPRFIQWYEYTGVFGGSFWILLVNIVLFQFVRIRFIDKVCSRQAALLLAASLLLILLPAGYSYYRYETFKEPKPSLDVVVVQPNLDPYSEQYELDPMDVTERMLKLAAGKADSLTQFIVFPESALQEYAWEDQLDLTGSVRRIREFNSSYPGMEAIVGMSTRKRFNPGEPLSVTARKHRSGNFMYDAYNTAVYIPHTGALELYHKSKLTPGVEKMPYPHLFRFLEKYALDLGGTVGSLGTDLFQKPFRIHDSLNVAPVICYESVYGEFVNRFIRNGANVIFVITNDGWWGNTAGHRQHLLFSVLRAIETRRSIVRSANTGISCFINPRGDISERTDYWVPDAIRAKVSVNTGITFYVKYGDYIGRIFLLVAGLFFLLTITVSFTGRRGRLR